MKSVSCFILLVIFSLAAADLSWEEFKVLYNKKYSEHEEPVRRTAFFQNLAMIERHNRLNKGYTLGVNKFSDMQFDEFNALYNGYQSDPQLSSSAVKHIMSGVSAPISLDWRSDHIVTPVKNQFQCLAGWAFSAVASLESQQALLTGKLVALSEQNLIDCSEDEGNQGCDGGSVKYAFKYIQNSGGIDTQYSYPYLTRQGPCYFNGANIGAKLSSWVDITKNDESALLDAVAYKGPISVAIDATFQFQMYYSGIFDDPSCNATSLNHAVTIVGFGTDNGTDFWLVKNSFGDTWGEKGYIRMIRGKNLCGIAAEASYPIVIR